MCLVCRPRMPWSKASTKSPPFFALHEKISWPVAFIMGLQHCLAMVGGKVIFKTGFPNEWCLAFCGLSCWCATSLLLTKCTERKPEFEARAGLNMIFQCNRRCHGPSAPGGPLRRAPDLRTAGVSHRCRTHRLWLNLNHSGVWQCPTCVSLERCV